MLAAFDCAKENSGHDLPLGIHQSPVLRVHTHLRSVSHPNRRFGADPSYTEWLDFGSYLIEMKTSRQVECYPRPVSVSHKPDFYRYRMPSRVVGAYRGDCPRSPFYFTFKRP